MSPQPRDSAAYTFRPEEPRGTVSQPGSARGPSGTVEVVVASGNSRYDVQVVTCNVRTTDGSMTRFKHLLVADSLPMIGVLLRCATVCPIKRLICAVSHGPVGAR